MLLEIGKWKIVKIIHNTVLNFNGTSSVPNSKYGLIFVKLRTKNGHFFGKNMGKVYEIMLSFCDLVHAQSGIDLFAKKLSNK